MVGDGETFGRIHVGNIMGKFASVVNDWRVIPRLLVVSGYIFYGYSFVWIVDWFMAFNWDGVTNEGVALALAAFPAAILAVLGTVLGVVTNNYFRTGGVGNNGG
jgi:hypothetical protein